MTAEPAKKKKGFAGALGKLAADGLSGFGAEDADTFTKVLAPAPLPDDAGRVEKIEVGLIDPSPDQTRPIDWDWVETLSLSIAEVGLDQPIKLRPNPDQPGRYLLIAGEHRWRAHIHAKIGTVDSIVVRDASAASSAVSTLIENLLRKDLTPLETAKGLRNLIDEYGYSYAQAGKVLGKGKTWVANHIGMLSLPEPVLEAVQRGALRDYTVIANIGKVFEQKPDQVAAALADATPESPLTRADLQRLDAPPAPAVESAPAPASAPAIPPAADGTGHLGGLETAPATTVPDVGSGGADGTAPAAAPAPKKSPATKRPAPAQVVVAIADGDELGTLILDAEADAGMAMVRLANGGSAPYPLAELRILRLQR